MKRFGTFSGVFTPSILTILGVIMYLRFPTILGQAGLVNTLGIIVVAHIISVTTSLSLASLATDKTVKTGGTYFMISRSLGLPIGGTLGIALYIGLSFSVSLYILGFSESFLSVFNIEPTLNNIRLAGGTFLTLITIVTFISTKLVLRTQFFIMGAMVLSLLSIFFGQHEFAPSHINMTPIANAAPFMLLFGIFFPAVTGFEAGVAMSGDLKDAKKSLPLGAISAVAVGFVIYVILAFFYAYTVDANMLANDSDILYKISLVPALVVAGIWGATLSSAFGSILGAPRILQAIAMDKMGHPFFAKGTRKNNEPHNALILTFILAMGGVLIGELDVIARVVSMFFITTYAFLNLASAIEKWSSSDFRPAFKVPGIVSIIGALAAFIVMILLDFLAFAGAVVVMAGLFFYLKRKQLALETGDAWGSFWTNLAKHSLLKLSHEKVERRNWRPNIILFSGGKQVRPHLLDLGLSLTGKLGALTDFEIIMPGYKPRLSKANGNQIASSKKPAYFERKFKSNNLFEGIRDVTSIYGFSGFEPNMIMMGMSRDKKNAHLLPEIINHLKKQDLSAAILNYGEKAFGKKECIDIWWDGTGRHLDFSLSMARFLAHDVEWQDADIRVLTVNFDSTIKEQLYKDISLLLNEKRINAEVLVLGDNAIVRNKWDVLCSASNAADLVLMGLPKEIGDETRDLAAHMEKLKDFKTSILLLHASMEFDEITLMVKKSTAPATQTDQQPGTDELKPIPLPDNSLLKTRLIQLETDLRNITDTFLNQVINAAINRQLELSTQYTDYVEGSIRNLSKALEKVTDSKKQDTVVGFHQSFLNFCTEFYEKEAPKAKTAIHKILSSGIDEYFAKTEHLLSLAPEQFILTVNDAVKNKERKINLPYAKLLHRMVHQRLSPNLLQQLYGFNHHTLKNKAQFKKSMLRVDAWFVSRSRKQITVEEYQILDQQLNDDLRILLNLHHQHMSTARNKLYGFIREEVLRLAEILSKRDVKWQIRLMLRKTKEGEEENIRQFPGIWSERTSILNNGIYLDAQVLSMNMRMRSALARFVERAQATIHNNVVKPAEIMLENIRLGPHQTATWKEVQLSDRLSLLNLFQETYGRIHEFTQRLSNKMQLSYIVTGEPGSQSPNQYEEKEVEPARIAAYYLETRINEPLTVRINAIEDELRQSIVDMREANSLLWFRLENWQKDTDIVHSEWEMKNFLEKLTAQLEGWHKLAIQRSEELQQEVLSATPSAVSPLYSHVIIQSEEKILSLMRAQKGRRFGIKLNKRFSKWKSKVNMLIVNLLYSSSDGLLLARKYLRQEEQTTTGIQQILDVVDKLRPNRKTLSRIPAFYRTLFSSKSLINEDFLVPMNQEMTVFQNALKRHREGLGGAIMISGVYGAGKSTFIRFATRRYFKKDRVFTIQPTTGEATIENWRLALQQSLGGGLHNDDIFEVLPVDSVIIIDDLELWWERSLQGYQVVNEIFRLVSLFGPKVMFVLGCNQFAFKQMAGTIAFHNHLLARIECKPFDTKRIQELIMLRHRSSGFSFNYKNASEQGILPIRMASLFHSLFRYSQGIPRVAMSGWLNSIQRARQQTLYLAKPELPDTEIFRKLDKDWLIIISLFAQHKLMTIGTLARVLRQNEDETKQVISLLMNAGLLVLAEHSSYRLTPAIEPLLIDVCLEFGLI